MTTYQSVCISIFSAARGAGTSGHELLIYHLTFFKEYSYIKQSTYIVHNCKGKNSCWIRQCLPIAVKNYYNIGYITWTYFIFNVKVHFKQLYWNPTEVCFITSTEIGFFRCMTKLHVWGEAEYWFHVWSNLFVNIGCIYLQSSMMKSIYC